MDFGNWIDLQEWLAQFHPDSPPEKRRSFDPVNVIGGLLIVAITALGLTQNPKPWSADANTAPGGNPQFEFELNPDRGKSPTETTLRPKRRKPDAPHQPHKRETPKPIDPRNVT